MSDSFKPAGFTETRFPVPFKVTIFPNSNHFHPVPGEAIGVEVCNQFGTKRLIVRYLSPPTRKVSGKVEYWPGGILYLAARDVEGWDRTK